MKLKLSFYFLLFLGIANIHAQNLGRYFIHNYTTKEYNAETQNWCIKQDANNFLYVGNNEALLEYDGVTWRKIYVANNSLVRSIDIDKNNNIYVGASSEFGVLKADDSGLLQYKSLSAELDTAKYYFTDIWQIMCLEKKIIFRSSEMIFFIPYFDITKKDNLLDINNMKVFKAKSKFYSVFNIDNQIYTIEKKTGLCLIKDDSLILAKNGDYFIKNIPFSILKYTENELICAIYRAGLIIYNTQTGDIRELQTNVYQKLADNRIYKGLITDALNYAYATLGGGVFIVDKNGNFITQINKTTGLKDDVVGFIYNEKNTGLWLATNTALSKVEINSPITFWDSNNAIASTIEDCTVFKNKIIISNINGIQYLDSTNFKTLENSINSQGWKFLILNKQKKDSVMIYGTGVGIYEYDGKNNKLIHKGINFRSLYKSTHYKNTIFCGYDKGFIILSDSVLKHGTTATNKDYYFIDFSDNFKFQADFITEDKYGDIWIFSEYEGIFKLSFTNFKKTEPFNFHKDSIKFVKFDKNAGLNSLDEIKIYFIDNELIVTSNRGAYAFDYDKQKFLPFRKYADKYADINCKVRFMEKDHDQNIWIGYEINQNANIDIIKLNKDNTFTIDSISLRRIQDMKLTEIFFHKHPKYTLIGGSEGLFKIDSNYTYTNFVAPKVFIRKVMLNSDSVVYWGNPNMKSNTQEFQYKYNNITFSFALPFFVNEKENLYSVILEDFDYQWSESSYKTDKEYTNLQEGQYIFKVRAKNIYGQITEPDIYIFTIEAPWYRTWTAYFGYVIIFVILFYIIIKLYFKKLTHEKQVLEQIVAERTKEILLINKELEKLSIVASQTDNAIVIADKEGNFEWINNGFTRLYGYTLEEFKLKYTNLLEASTNDNLIELYNFCVTNKKSVIYESFLITKNEEKIWAQSTITPILDTNNQVIKLIIIDTDITKIKKAEQEILQKNEEISAQKEALEQQNEEISAQRDELEDKNIEINIKNDMIKGSIRYAQTIQLAILPDINLINDYFDNFLIYKPKDIVSGDFYWFYNNNKTMDTDNNAFYFAVVDCTGHGVPGAFMSMIASRILNEIVIRNYNILPSQILNELNDNIIKALRQKQTDNKDGMDMCLVKLLKSNENTKIIFSGAKRELFFYNSLNNSINKQKADRKSIGGVYERQAVIYFTDTDIVLAKDSILYLSTDGLVDQNNSKRKRFGTTKLLQVLEDNKLKDLKCQKNILEAELSAWQIGEEQRDDITFWAIKI